ncbi:hypothetical protein QTO34_000555 [Cnephaeus nilssonii]|uniref:Uncharacterized protein n=1 Tax=Cnephaeus nilssonii TaxID=3371016 RepID=A0AA40LUS2_CNENI|nr:hypothetical protein QTO34_000555 [Eptesicus nilssonii]
METGVSSPGASTCNMAVVYLAGASKCYGATLKRLPPETEIKIYEPLLSWPVTTVAALYSGKGRTAVQITEDSMAMDMSPLRPQNYLFGCELKANKDYHFKVDNDENDH